MMGYGLSTCATCDGAFHRGDDVLIIGGGDSAMEEALFLAKFANSVTVVHRRDELRASDTMARRARENESIEVRWNAELSEIHGSQKTGVTGATLVTHPAGHPRARLEEGESVETERVDIGGIFYGIGHVPNTEFLAETLTRARVGRCRGARSEQVTVVSLSKRSAPPGVPQLVLFKNGQFCIGDRPSPTRIDHY